MENLIPFKRKENPVAGNLTTSDKEAFANLDILKNILQANIDILNTGDVDQSWMIMNGSPFDFGNKPLLQGFVTGYYQGRIQAVLDKLNSDAVMGSYLKSVLVGDLDTAMQFMEADHLTRIQIWEEQTLTTLVLNRTWEVWVVVNLFVNGKSMHTDAVEAARERLNLTDEDMFQWKEADPTL